MNEKPGWFHISMTSGHKRLARSMLLILCAAISLIFTGAFVTYAVLKTVTPTATNVFQSDKNIRIKLDEPQWEDHGRSEALGYVPGQKIDKDPTVTLQADSVDSYVALKVQYYDADNQELTREEFGKLYLNKDKLDEVDSEGIDYSYAWEYIGMSAADKGEVYIYRDILSQDAASTVKKENVTEPLFTRVYLSKDIQQDEVKKKLPEFNIKITAYAIQADGITYDSAKTEMMGFINSIADY